MMLTSLALFYQISGALGKARPFRVFREKAENSFPNETFIIIPPLKSTLGKHLMKSARNSVYPDESAWKLNPPLLLE